MSVSALPLPRPAIDAATFEIAAENLAGAVAVVAWGGAQPRGVLVHTVSVLSSKPPRILFAVDKREPEHDALLLEQACSVSLLNAEDREEADRFVRRAEPEDRFPAGRWGLRSDEPPQLIGSLAHFSGVIDQKIDAGSHSLFIVRVCNAAVRDSAPLVYFHNAFHSLPAASAGAGIAPRIAPRITP